MAIKELSLAWLVVKDVKKAVDFYVNVVGMKLNELNEQFGWAELVGSEGGARLGIAQTNARETIQPGQNAVITLTVENLQEAKESLIQKGAEIVGEIVEVPGIVRLQMVKDQDDNHFQLVEVLKD